MLDMPGFYTSRSSGSQALHNVKVGPCGKLLILDGQLRGNAEVARSCRGGESLHGALPSSRNKARAFKMFIQSLLSPQAQARAPLLLISGASRGQRASVHCRGLHGQQNSQQSWPVKLGSAGAGLAALAYLAVASPAGTRNRPCKLSQTMTVPATSREGMDGINDVFSVNATATRFFIGLRSGINQDWRVHSFWLLIQGLSRTSDGRGPRRYTPSIPSTQRGSLVRIISYMVPTLGTLCHVLCS